MKLKELLKTIESGQSIILLNQRKYVIADIPAYYYAPEDNEIFKEIIDCEVGCISTDNANVDTLYIEVWED